MVGNVNQYSNVTPLSWCANLSSTVFYYSYHRRYEGDYWDIGTNPWGNNGSGISHVSSSYGLQIRPVISYGN